MSQITNPYHKAPFINVADANTASDGVTDDAAKIQSVIDASPFGSTIFFPGNHAIGGNVIQLRGGRTYLGPIWQTGSTPTFIQQNTANLPAVLASYEWYNNVTTSGDPVVLRNIFVDANKANNTTSAGIVLMNYDPIVSECTVQNTPGAGIIISSVNRGGTSISNNVVEPRVEKCKIINSGSYGIYIRDINHKNTDGYIENCIIETPGDVAIYLDYSAGYFIRQNHVYGCPFDGIIANFCWSSQIKDNEIDGYGQSATNNFYSGISASLIGPRASIIEGNTISVVSEVEGTHYQYLNVVGSGATDTKAIVANNTIQGGYVNTSSTTSLVSGAKTPCAPLSMVGIVAGVVLFVGTEAITVASVTSTTFTPTTNWVSNHGTASYSVSSNKATAFSQGLLLTSNSTQQTSTLPCTIVSMGNRVDGVGKYDFIDSYTTVGPVGLDGGIAVTPSVATTLTNGATIPTLGIGQSIVTATGNVTGIILQKGTQGGQVVYVTNRANFTITFSGAGNVNDGSADVIGAGVGATYVWDSGFAQWFRV